MRSGARRYATLLSLPGARGPVLFSAVGSIPIGMFGLAILLLAEDTTGSFAVAGRVVGAFGIGSEGAGTGVLYACAAAGGLSLPQLPAAMRSLWSTLARDDEQRETAYAMVAIVFEVSVITAPALAAAIVESWSHEAGALAAGAIAALGAVVAAARRRTLTPPVRA